MGETIRFDCGDSWVVMFDRLLVGKGGFDLDFRIIRNRSHKQSHLRTRTGEYVSGDSIDLVSEMVMFDRNLIPLIHKLDRESQCQLIQLNLPLSWYLY